MSNPSLLISTTDYPRERLIKKIEGSFSASGSDSVGHGLTFRPLVLGYFSNTPDFKNKTPFAEQYFVTGDGNFGDVLSVNTWSGLSEIRLFNSGGFISGMVYYRIFCVSPEDADADVGYSAQFATQIIQDSTDYNFSKLVKYGKVSVPPGGSVTVQHNYGDTPYVQIWRDEDGWIKDYLNSQISLGQDNQTYGFAYWAEPGDNVVDFKSDPSTETTMNLIYRIWGE